MGNGKVPVVGTKITGNKRFTNILDIPTRRSAMSLLCGWYTSACDCQGQDQKWSGLLQSLVVPNHTPEGCGGPSLHLTSKQIAQG
eukprot:6477998-Amphidinium_carterae.1